MIAKINQLKSQINITEVQNLCESTINAISSAIYNGVTNEAKLEIERIALTNLFNGLQKYSKYPIIKEWVSNQQRVYFVKNIGIRKAINTLIEKESKYDITLGLILEDFRNRLEQDIPEVLLYESFISAMSGFNHLPAVNTELSAVSTRVNQYKNDINISKIIETMKETRSNYLIPLIEDVIDNYLSDKSEQSRSHLKETLVKFSYDPFIRDIINIVTLDATQLQLEYANAECNINDKLFSPILYLGENEVMFNVKGTYYIKRGNNINKIKKNDIANINESFKNLCDLINQPNIEVSKENIKIYIGKDNAVLTESQTLVNGDIFTRKQINESVETAKLAGNEIFFNTINTLRENFDEIAELDFVKRAYLKENENYAADVFKLRDNIFITTFDPVNNKSTFYRNINPIQAEKIMMEHLRLDVSKTFASILPSKEKILSEIEETKLEYSSYITELQNKINEFSHNYQDNKISPMVINILNEELDSVKNDYKNYLNEVEKFINVRENLNITVQDDNTGKSYTVVVPTGAMAAKGENVSQIGKEGDEFGTEVGSSSIKSDTKGSASAITFDSEESELLSDQPSIKDDKVDMDADNEEAYADKVDMEAELKKPDETIETKDSEFDDKKDPTTELDLDDMKFGSDEEGEKDNIEDEDKEVEGEEDKNVEDSEEQKETSGPPNKNLEKTKFNKDKNPNDLNEPKKIKKVFLKRHKK